MSRKEKAAKIPALWSHCNECGHDTLHKVVKQIQRSRDFDHDRYVVTMGSNWKILQCSGCHEVSMNRIDWCSEDDPQDPSVSTYFPPRISRRKPDWLVRREAPGYQGLLDEVYAALHADSRRLAMMGARAVIDKAIAKQAGDRGTFSQGIDALEKAGIIGKLDRPLIDAAFDAGSASMHRNHQPSIDSLNTVIDIVERVVHAEVLAEKAKELAATTPPRPARVKKRKNSEKKEA
jgi:hypothetical protein